MPAELFWLRKLTTEPHVIADVIIACLGKNYPKLKIYISELILDNYEFL
jgi:hypothetical protein